MYNTQKECLQKQFHLRICARVCACFHEGFYFQYDTSVFMNLIRLHFFDVKWWDFHVDYHTFTAVALDFSGCYVHSIPFSPSRFHLYWDFFCWQKLHAYSTMFTYVFILSKNSLIRQHTFNSNNTLTSAQMRTIFVSVNEEIVVHLFNAWVQLKSSNKACTMYTTGCSVSFRIDSIDFFRTQNE